MEIENQNSVPLKRADRNSNIELLRIICMLLLIAHHCIVHGGALAMENCTNKWIGFLFVPVGKICFDAFVAISAWYTVDSKFKASRFFRIWFQVLFYNVVFTGLTALLGNGYAQPITWRTWLGAFFPIIGNSHGFAASYTIYYLCTPFLHYVAERLTKRRAALLVGILFLTQVFSTIWGNVTFYTQPMPSEILLFVLFYFTAFYLKRWPIRLEENIFALLLIVLGTWICLTVIRFENIIYPDNRFFAVTMDLSGSESYLVNIIAGFALFLFFKNLKMPKMPRLNLLASTTFGILLFHDHNYFRPVVWGKIIQTNTWLNTSPASFILRLFLSVAVIFILGAIIDFTRQRLIETALMKAKVLTKVCSWLNGVIEEKFPNQLCEQEASQNIYRIEEPQTEPSEHKLREGNKSINGSDAGYFYRKWFSIGVLVCTVFYWLICIITRSSNINAYFVFDHYDTGMDYFNMLANLSHDDPWGGNANYPAMCFLVLNSLFRMLPTAVYANGIDGFVLRENMIAQLGYILLVLVNLIVLWEVLQHFTKGPKAEKILFAASLLFSGPMSFLLERGNLLLLSLVSLLVYFLLYDSPQKGLRYIGYVCLAFSASLKIYPAIFGLLVPMKKRWKETGHLVVIGMVMFLIPFFFFGGFKSLLAMFRGFIAARDVTLDNGLGYNFSFRAFLSLCAAVFGIQKEIWPTWVLVFPVAISLWIIFIGDQEWKKLFGMTLLCVWLPDFSYTYCLTFFIVPLVYFMNCEQVRCKFNTLYTVLFVLLIVPYFVPMLPSIDAVSHLGVGRPASWASFIINYVIVLFALFILLEHYTSETKVKIHSNEQISSQNPLDLPQKDMD